jgi:hypothetical protein
MILPKMSISLYRRYVQELVLNHVAKGQHSQFKFGLQTLTSHVFVSLNSNARISPLSRSAAESKMLRLVSNHRIRCDLVAINLAISGVTPDSFVNVDHSEYRGLSVLLFALQTRNGRALPLYLETMPSTVQGHQRSSPNYQAAKNRYQQWKLDTGQDQHGYTIVCLQRLKQQLGYLPRLVFDRGFVNKRILKYLKSVGAKVYVRAREDFKVNIAGHRVRIADLSAGSYIVTFGVKLRLVVGGSLATDNNIAILTTDFESYEGEILRAYYHRFEIEELIRDLKSIFGTKNSHIKKPEHLATLLLFVCLRIQLLHRATVEVEPSSPEQRNYQHPKKRLSFIRSLLESYQQQMQQYSNKYSLGFG